MGRIEMKRVGAGFLPACGVRRAFAGMLTSKQKKEPHPEFLSLFIRQNLIMTYHFCRFGRCHNSLQAPQLYFLPL